MGGIRSHTIYMYALIESTERQVEIGNGRNKKRTNSNDLIMKP